jgi:hypothetical protein
LIVTFNYAIDTWDMGLWRPVCRKSVAVLHIVRDPLGRLELTHAAVVVPSCFKSFGFDDIPASSCPPSPEEVSRWSG